MAELLHLFIENRNVSWIGTCFGNYDIKMSFYAHNNQEFQDVLSSALSGYKEHIKAQEVVGITKKYKMDNTLFLSMVLKENFNPFLKLDDHAKEKKNLAGKIKYLVRKIRNNQPAL